MYTAICHCVICHIVIRQFVIVTDCHSDIDLDIELSSLSTDKRKEDRSDT